MLIQELKKLVKGIVVWGGLWIGVSFLFFSNIFYGKSITVYVFDVLVRKFLPTGVDLIVTNPFDAFIGHIIVSLSLSFIAIFPIILYRIIRYISPALFNKEKVAVLQVMFPSVILFMWGCFFSYRFLVPTTFKLLYPFASDFNAIPFFLVTDFIYMIFGILIATGVLFLLPIFMILLSLVGLVNSRFWIENWRISLFFSLLFSAIITPDGTGVTMLMLTIPLAGLYGVGSAIAILLDRKRL